MFRFEFNIKRVELHYIMYAA